MVPRERTLLGGVIISVVFYFLFAQSTKTHTGFSGADDAVWRFFSKQDVHFIHSTAHAITSVGVVSVLLPLSLGAGCWIFVRSKSFAYAVAPFFSVQITATLVSTVKKSVNSARPPISSHIYPVHSAAFPSGHAADTTALVVAVAVFVWAISRSDQVRRDSAFAACVVIVVMGATRLILNVHWLSDVLGGTFLGMAVALTVSTICIRTDKLLKRV